jgi:large subunit ribosomal protein L24
MKARKIEKKDQTKWKVKRGDNVIVLTGKCKGQVGEILKVNKERNRIFVKGINLIKRHVKATANKTGGIIEVESSIHVSNVSHVENGKPVKIGYRILENGDKERYSKRSGEAIGDKHGQA